MFLAQGVMLRPSARRLPQQVGRGGAIAPGSGTRFRPEDRKVAKCGTTGESARAGLRHGKQGRDSSGRRHGGGRQGEEGGDTRHGAAGLRLNSPGQARTRDTAARPDGRRREGQEEGGATSARQGCSRMARVGCTRTTPAAQDAGRGQEREAREQEAEQQGCGRKARVGRIRATPTARRDG